MIDPLTIQLFKAEGIFTLVMDAYQPDERAYSIPEDSLQILIERMTALSLKPGGHDLMSFDRLNAQVPPDENLPDEEDID